MQKRCCEWGGFPSSSHTMLEEGCRLDPGAGGGVRTPWGHLGLCWAHQTGTSLGPAGCGWEQGGCWPRVLGAAQLLPRSSCRERAAFPADGCSREGRSILQRASPCPSTQRTAAFTESRKEKVQTLLTSGHTELQRGPFGCSWMGCPGLALPPTALQTLRAGQPLLLPWKSVCTATAKKNSQ